MSYWRIPTCIRSYTRNNLPMNIIRTLIHILCTYLLYSSSTLPRNLDINFLLSKFCKVLYTSSKSDWFPEVFCRIPQRSQYNNMDWRLCRTNSFRNMVCKRFMMNQHKSHLDNCYKIFYLPCKCMNHSV